MARPGWFQSETLLYCGFGTTPRVIASQSRCPPDSGGQSSHLPRIRFIHSFGSEHLPDPVASRIVELGNRG
jgi:hypothetical protein